jgi:hypothetical protein
MTDETPRTPFDSRMLAAFAREVEEADPVAWGALPLDRGMAYDIVASQIAERFRGYEDKGVGRDQQLVIALATVVKLSVENFVLHQRIMRAGAASDGG